MSSNMYAISVNPNTKSFIERTFSVFLDGDERYVVVDETSNTLVFSTTGDNIPALPHGERLNRVFTRKETASKYMAKFIR
jgi:hypothetical protein